MASFRSLFKFGALGALAFLTLAGCGQSAPLEDSPREDTETSATPQAQPLESAVQEVASKLCDQDTYTSRVTNLSCSPTHVTFGSIGLPDNLANVMVGITATNQQYPRPHSYEFSFPLSPTFSPTPTVPDPGPIGVAVDGVPLFSPWTQAEIRTHTSEMGELDTCGGHAGRGDDYHYHVAPNCLIDQLGEEHVDIEKRPIGIANDANRILALGWFIEANNVESQLDECRGMTDSVGTYFYNVQPDGLHDILDCFTYEVHKTSRDKWESRLDSSGANITGAKLAMTITAAYAQEFGSETAYVMTGNLKETLLVLSSGSTSAVSGPVGIFYVSPRCYAEYFEPDSGGFPGGTMFYEVVTSDCPTGFDFDSLVLTAPYEGPKIEKRAARG
jgi:predicted small lipoprotein YifL